MASIKYGKQVPSATAATTSQAGYGPSNLTDERLARPYRATGVGANDITLSLASARPIHTLFLHDVNFAAANVYKSADGVAFNPVGALSSYQGKEGRRRGAIVINDAAVKAVKVSIAAGVATDGLSYWRAGAAYLFDSSAAIASPFQVPYTPRFRYPQVRTDLPNGQTAVAATGTPFHTIELPFRPFDNEDLEPIVRLARASTILLDLELATFPAQLWPVRIDEEAMEESYVVRASDVKLTFREMA